MPIEPDLPPLSPMDAVPMARPAAGAPLAAPVEARPIPTGARGFPELGMPRLSACVDLLIAVGLIIGAEVLIVAPGLAEFLAAKLPALGLFWPNVILGLTALAVVGIILRARQQRWSAVGLGPARPATVAIAAMLAVWACYAAMLIVVPLFMTLIGMSTEELLVERGELFEEIPELPAWGALLFAMFVGLHEEVLFRGFLLGRLQSVFRSNAAAVITCTLIFGVLHGYQGVIGIVQTGTVGLLLAILSVRMRTLWPAVIAHGIFDTVGLLLIPWLRENFEEVLGELTTTSSISP